MSQKIITLRDVLAHLQAFRSEMGVFQKNTTMRFERLEHKMDLSEHRMDRIHTSLSMQIQGIDERLDDIELEELPKRVRRLEVKVFGAGKR